MSFPFQSAAGCPRATSRCFAVGSPLAHIAGCLGTSTRRGTAFARSSELDARAASFREANRNGLLGRTSAVLPFADMVHFFSDKFSGLCAGRLAFTCIFASAFQCSFFRHAPNLTNASRGLHRVRAVAGEPGCLRMENTNSRVQWSVRHRVQNEEIAGLPRVLTQT